MELFCQECAAPIHTRHEQFAHIASALHDQFVVRSSDGITWVSVADNGADAEVAARHARDREARLAEEDTRRSEFDAYHAALLKETRSGLIRRRAGLVRAQHEMARLGDVLSKDPRQRRGEALPQKLRELAHYVRDVSADIPRAEADIQEYAATVKRDKQDALTRAAERAAYVPPPVPGRALEEARWNRDHVKRFW